MYGWSLWNHLQFLETSGDMKKAFSTEKERLAELILMNSGAQLVNNVAKCLRGSRRDLFHETAVVNSWVNQADVNLLLMYLGISWPKVCNCRS